MKRRILLTLSLASASFAAGQLAAHPHVPARPMASEKCLVTDDTYVAGHKVLDQGRYCVPWV